MKIAVSILIAGILFLLWDASNQRSKIDIQLSQISDLTAKLKDKIDQETFERQKACAIQSDGLLKQLGYDSAKDLMIRQNHFNRKLQKCFLTYTYTTFSGKSPVVSSFLMDAYEQRAYATSIGFDNQLTICLLSPIGAAEYKCVDRAEYAGFVAQYME